MNKHFYIRLLALLMVLAPLSIFGSNNLFTPEGKTLAGCEGVSVTGGAGTITVSGLGTYSHIQVFTPDFAAQVYNQELFSSSVTIPIATAGSYIVKIWSNPNPAAFCEENFPVTVGGGGGNPPVANPDNATTPQGTPVTINVTANDQPNGTLQMVMLVSNPANGSVVLNGNSYVYTPNAGFSGVDQFTYKIVTSSGTSNTTTVTITVPTTDPCANDVTAPVISGCTTGGVTVTAAAGATCATATYATPTATDNCPNVTMTRVLGLASGSCFPIGTTLIKYMATDASGNTAICVFNVVVNPAADPCANDVTAPVISGCTTGGVTVTAALGATCANATYATPTATDNCPNVTMTRVLGLASGSCFPIGTTLIKYMATDAKGNTAICVFNVVVNPPVDPCANDVTPPTISCPANINKDVTGMTGTCWTITYANATATDNCGTATVVRESGLASGSCFPVGISHVVFKATDAKGNVSRCTLIVNITKTNPCANDVTAPVISCPANINKDVTGMSGTCWTITYANATATDNCGTATVVRESGLASGSCFPVGLSYVVFKATDAKGNVARCTLTINIIKTNPCANDVTAPVISCPANINKDVTGMSGSCWTISYANATATDNCGTATVVRESGLASGSCFPVGISHVVFKATDAKGNVSRCTLIINISRATCTVSFDPNKCYKIVNKSSGKVLDVYGWSHSNDARIQQYPYAGQTNQKWKIVSIGSGYYKIVNVNSGKVLANHDTYNGAKCYQYDYYTGGAKDWKIECYNGSYKLTHRASSRALCFANTSTGTQATIDNWTGASNMQWEIVEVSCANYVHASSSEMLTMNASAEPTRSRLEWVSNTGYKNDYFKVEKMNSNSGAFEQLEVVNNKNNTESPEHYATFDENPVEGDNVYRVTLVYNDGTNKVSELKTVNFKGLDGVRTFPNPADYVLDVDLSKYKGTAVSLYLYNQFGQQVLFQNVDKVGGGTIRLDVAEQQTGNYVLRVAAKGKRDVMQKIVITK